MLTNKLKRYTIYLLSIVIALVIIIIPSRLTNTALNVKKLIEIAEHSDLTDSAVSIKTDIGYLKIIPSRGYVLVLAVQHDARFAPGEFVIIFRLDSNQSVQLINGPGRENTIFLQGEDAKRFLEKYNIDLLKLDQIVKNH